VEARLASCEEKASSQEARIDGGTAYGRAARDVAQAVREVQMHFSNALTEAQGRWQTNHLELQSEQREQLRQLEELTDRLRHAASRVENMEQDVGMQEQFCRKFDDQLQGLVKDWNTGPQFGMLDAALLAVERRLNEQQVAVELQLGRVRVDVDGLQRNSEALVHDLRREAAHAAEARVERELARLAASGGRPAATASEQTAGRDQGRRLDDVDSRVASLRVRVDAHDGRFSSLGERVEAACSQAVEAARQVAAQQREEILSEADCKIGLLRQRVESLGEFCEEMLLRNAHPHRGHSRQ